MSTHLSSVTPGSTAQPNGKQTRAPAFLLPIFKLPLVLYRLRLGWLFGHRFLLLTHVGRKSGKVRSTILAVLSYDAQTREIKAVSAWNASEWYKNIKTAPALEVETGFTRYAPSQRDLTAEEIAQLFVDYRKNHPIFIRIVCRIPGWKWDSSYAEFLELARTLRGVAFRPQSSGRTNLDNPCG
ncbi:MAG: nitroreductase family deazaflavin-dependent oxidoreductase [Chloroflexi bacterium]|nr:MAG: nitroreductase family deazaflavin-dependent oxidoreductase [Chloroflexota bacterium]